jgi:hypothetical protein
MSIMSFLTNHRHYWGVPHGRLSDDRMVMTCYECGAERVIKIELRPWLLQRLLTGRS